MKYQLLWALLAGGVLGILLSAGITALYSVKWRRKRVEGWEKWTVRFTYRRMALGLLGLACLLAVASALLFALSPDKIDITDWTNHLLDELFGKK